METAEKQEKEEKEEQEEEEEEEQEEEVRGVCLTRLTGSGSSMRGTMLPRPCRAAFTNLLSRKGTASNKIALHLHIGSCTRKSFAGEDLFPQTFMCSVWIPIQPCKA